MCVGYQASLNKEDAALKLARLLCGDGGGVEAVVLAQCLRTTIRDHWSKVAALAHQIHDEEEAKKKEIKVGDEVVGGEEISIAYRVIAIAEGVALLKYTKPREYALDGHVHARYLSELRKV